MNRLWVRLTLAFLIVAWLVIGAMALVVQRTTEAGFRQYLNQRNASEVNQDQISRLEQYYAQQGTWAGAEIPTGGTGRGENAGRGATLSLTDTDGRILASTDSSQIGTVLPQKKIAQAVELVVDGGVVGYLYRQTPGGEALGTAETAFLNEASRTLAIAAGIVSILAVGIGVGLARILVRPLNQLTTKILGLAGGKLGQQVHVRGTVEINELAQAYNTVSSQLAEGETLRQRMAADIAHELRTPVSVLRGHLEAMRDGVFALDQEHLAVIYDQTLYLGRLVDDLRLLTLSEARHLPLNVSPLSLSDLTHELIESFQPLALDADVQLTFSDSSSGGHIEGDAMRLRQVLGNLLTNALRHTPPGSEIAVQLQQVGGKVKLTVGNTGSRISPEEAQKIFLPFWRASESRERDTGGSGLGLAISKQLIELHGGRMWVETSEGWVHFIIELCVA